MRRGPGLSCALLLLLAAAPARAGRKNGPVIDLHSHLVGAISSAGLYEIAVKHDLQFPREHLAQMGLAVPPAAAVGLGRMVSMRAFDQHATDLDRGRFVSQLTFPDGSSYASLEVTYGFRKALMPDFVIDDVLRGIGQEAARAGVRYIELSTNKIFEMEASRREGLGPLVREIERETGVRLRFLHSFKRDRSVEANLAELHEADAMGLYGPGSVVVGIDIMGQEHNSILEQAPLLKAVKQLKLIRPGLRDFEVQVHAGETPDFPGNVRQSILLGATRIAHGVHGITNEVIRLARMQGVVFELALTSNTKLGTAATHAVFRRLVQARVPVVISTDGHGIFGVHAREEMLRAIRALDLAPRHVRRVFRTNKRYLEKKGAWRR